MNRVQATRHTEDIGCFNMNREFLKLLTRQVAQTTPREEQKSDSDEFKLQSMFSDKNIKRESFDDVVTRGGDRGDSGGGDVGGGVPPVDSDIAILHNIEEFGSKQ